MRHSLPAVLLIALFGVAPATASANPTMCLAVNASPAPVEMASLEGGLSGISIDESVWVPVHAPGRGGLPALWCSSPDDPRCSASNPPGDNAPQVDEIQLRSDSKSRADVNAAASSALRFFADDGFPRAGVTSRIERPPRS